MTPTTQPLAEVKVMKMKECPMLTAGTITLLIMQLWNLACKHYKKHGRKLDTEIVSYAAKGMFELHLVVQYLGYIFHRYGYSHGVLAMSVMGVGMVLDSAAL